MSRDWCEECQYVMYERKTCGVCIFDCPPSHFVPKGCLSVEEEI